MVVSVHTAGLDSCLYIIKKVVSFLDEICKRDRIFHLGHEEMVLIQ